MYTRRASVDPSDLAFFSLSSYRYSSSRQCEEGGVDVRVEPRTGVVERVVLVHCADTRRVAFGVGNASRCSRAMVRGLEVCVLDGANT